jgi:hypothetical protein
MAVSQLHSQKSNINAFGDEKDKLTQEVEQVEGTVRLFDSEGHVRNIPIPSNDRADPLTWPTWKRSLVLISICVFGTAGFGVVQSTPLFFTALIPEYMRETRGVRTRSSAALLYII